MVWWRAMEQEHDSFFGHVNYVAERKQHIQRQMKRHRGLPSLIIHSARHPVTMFLVQYFILRSS
ncbi:hypothetical protein [Paenibacillus sp. 1-18]|uniref:hypothetical protein n=1 Tax=Paenibacillus sp. 1-18 TaxID=1333846 RepID=UPI000470935A|nr:hypothetical protein [Paenibacillus sp. 1-18]